MTVPELIPVAARRVAAVVRNAAGADLGNPTPCTDFDLRRLVHHFTGTTTGLARAGRRQPLDPQDPWGSRLELADDDWSARLAGAIDEVGDAWSAPGAWQGSVDLGGGTMPAGSCGEMAFAEILLHGWDLAAATGQQLVLDAGVDSELRRVITETAELGRQMHAYGAEVPVPDRADDFDHALGLAGRDPDWRPPTR